MGRRARRWFYLITLLCPAAGRPVARHPSPSYLLPLSLQSVALCDVPRPCLHPLPFVSRTLPSLSVCLSVCLLSVCLPSIRLCIHVQHFFLCARCPSNRFSLRLLHVSSITGHQSVDHREILHSLVDLSLSVPLSLFLMNPACMNPHSAWLVVYYTDTTDIRGMPLLVSTDIANPRIF